MIAKNGDVLTLNAVAEWLVAYGLPGTVLFDPCDWLNIARLFPESSPAIYRDMLGVKVVLLGCDLRPKTDCAQSTLDVSRKRLTEDPR